MRRRATSSGAATLATILVSLGAAGTVHAQDGIAAPADDARAATQQASDDDAAPAASEPASGDASDWTRTFGDAVAHMADGDLDGAARLFGVAYQQGARPEALFNQGLALSRAGRHAAAFDAFDRVVGRHSHELDATALGDALARRAAEAALTGLAEIRTERTAGELWIDGRRGAPIDAGEHVELRLDPGAHHVELRWGTHRAARAARDVDVVAGTAAVVVFDLQIATVRVRAPDGAEITIDGEPAGRGLVTFELASGADVELAAAGETRRVRISPTGPTDVALGARAGDDTVLVVVLVAACVVALAAGAISVGVWGAEQSAGPYSSEPFGVVEVLRGP